MAYEMARYIRHPEPILNTMCRKHSLKNRMVYIKIQNTNDDSVIIFLVIYPYSNRTKTDKTKFCMVI